MKTWRSAPELARMSGLEGCQLMDVMVFLCSDMMDRRRNSLKWLSSCEKYDHATIKVLYNGMPHSRPP